MPLFNKTPKAASASDTNARRQSADRTPSRQQSINSINSTTSGNRRGSVTHAQAQFEQDDGPRPVQASQKPSRTRVRIPKAAYEKPKPSTSNGSVPGGARTAGDAIKDGCAYAGLGYAGCSTAVTYPVTAATCLTCGLFGCCFGTCCIGGPLKGTYKGAKFGTLAGSYLSSAALCVPCVDEPSVKRLEKSGKIDRAGARKTMKRLHLHFRGETGSKLLDETFPRAE